jgi:DAACS family dicarboxylate/amino acid:cation (Na+ or H+) symporter
VRRFPLGAQLALALVAGGLTGRALGSAAAPLGALALVYVKLLKLLATPLVFVAIVDTFARTRVALKPALVLVGLSTVNALVACGIALGGMHLLPLDRLVDAGVLVRAAAPPTAAPSGLERAIAWVSTEVLERVIVENVLWVIAAAIVVGLALRLRPSETLGRFIARALAILMRVLRAAVRGVPLAAFGVVAKVVGGSGLQLVGPLLVFSLLVASGIALQAFGWYALLVRLAGRSPLRFFRTGAEALYTAFAGGSSLATLPVTLRTLESDLGVAPEHARLAACVGTNLNHDGIILYEAVAALFVAHAFALPLGLGAQLRVVGTSVLAAIGIAGVPEAGLVTLSLVLGAAGLPLAAVPLLMPVDWLLGRLRATANVASDLTVATLLDRAVRR